MQELDSGASAAVESIQPESSIVQETVYSDLADDSQPQEEVQAVEEKPENVAPKKKPSGWIKKLTKAEQRIAFLEGQLASAQSGKPNAVNEPQAETEPQTYHDMMLSETEKKVKEALTGYEKQQEEKVLSQTYGQKIQAYEKENPGIIAKLQEINEAGLINDDLAKQMMRSEVAPELSAFLADNPEALFQMKHMSKEQANIALARIEGMVLASKRTPATPELRQTKAPTPIAPVKAQGSGTNKPGEHMSQREWEAYMIKMRRGG